jgi:uncharacterized protein
MMRWWDVLKGPPAYRADTPWSPSAAIGAVALIVSVQLTLPLILYGLSPEFCGVISGETGQPRIWPPSGSPFVGLFQIMGAGCLVWFISGRGNGKRRAVLCLHPFEKGDTYTYLALALIVFSVERLLSYSFVFFFHKFTNPSLSVLGSSSPWLWMDVLLSVIGGPLVEELIYRGFLLSALAKSRIGFWGAAILTDAIWTALHAPSPPSHLWYYALVPIFAFGLLVSLLLRQTGNLWSCIFAHVTFNAEQLLIQVVAWQELR